MNDFDPTHDKISDQPVTVGGDKSAAAWHPNRAPFTPTTEQIRTGYAIDPEAEYRDPITNWTAINERYFDRWLALHDAEVKAQALDEAKQIVTTVCRDELSDYYGQVRVEVNAALDRRAAEIRKQAK